MTETTFALPDPLPFQEAGEVCLSCNAIWEHHDPPKASKIMVAIELGDGTPVTTDYGIPIVICPWCDGDPILQLPKIDVVQ